VPYLRGYGGTRFLSSDTPRNGQQSVVAVDIIALMDALKIQKATIGGFDWGARTDDATFDRTAVSLVNPDHVDIVIHNYRWRLGLAEGEPKFDDLEKRLAMAPSIEVPTITLEGDANGAPHPEASSYANKFSGKYAHWIVKGGVGHNLPQEAPQAFAEAIGVVDKGL
jgi:pimeloyl-ACP methyl ester carboxylesterase